MPYRRAHERLDLAAVRTVGAMGDEPERAVQTDRGVVVGVDVEHADGDPASGERLEPGGGERPAEPAALATRIGADHVDLTECIRFAWRLRRVHLGPAEPGEAVGVEGQDEALGVEPVLLLAGAQHVDRPRPLLGMSGERPVVHGNPRRFVLADAERPDGGAVGPAGSLEHGVGEREGDAHLEEVALGDEPGAGGACVGGGIGFGAVHPVGHVTAAVGRDHRDGIGEQRVEVDGSAGEGDELHRPLVVVVTGEMRVRVARHVEHAAVTTCERVHPGPGVVTQRHDAGRGLDGVGERADACDVGGREVAQHGSGGHRRRVAAAGSFGMGARPALGTCPTGRERAMEIDHYEPGVPSWIDIGSPNPQGAADFYGALFGWEAPEGPPETEGYRVAMIGNRSVAGIGVQAHPGPPVWATYIAVESTDETVAKVLAAGGQVIVPAMDVLDVGPHGDLRRPGRGRVLGVAGRARTPVPSWSTSPAPGRGASCSPPTSRRRRPSTATVFGWAHRRRRATARPPSTPSGRSGGRSVGGMMQKPPMMPGRRAAVLGGVLRGGRHRRRGRARHRARRHGRVPGDGHRAGPLRGRRRPLRCACST